MRHTYHGYVVDDRRRLAQALEAGVELPRPRQKQVLELRPAFPAGEFVRLGQDARPWIVVMGAGAVATT